MTAEDLRKTLESSNDKLSVFADRSTLADCDDLTVSKLLDLINSFLNDSQKAELLEFNHFKKQSVQIRASIATSISDSSLKLQLLIKHDSILSDLRPYQITDFIKSFDSPCKLSLLKDSASLKRLKLDNYSISSVAESLSDNDKVSLLSDMDYAREELQLNDFLISKIISNVNDDKVKLDLLSSSSISSYYKSTVLKKMSDATKIPVLLDNTYGLSSNELAEVFASMDVEPLIDCFNTHSDFFAQNKVSLQTIVRGLPKEKQISFIGAIDNVNLSVRRKKKNLCHFTRRS